MKRLMKRFWKEEDGIETIELVVIVAVLMAVALVFREGIISFVKERLMPKVFNADVVPAADAEQ